MNQQQPILPMQDEEEWWLEGRPLHSASGAVPGRLKTQPITPHHVLDQSFHSDAPNLGSFALFGGGIAPNRLPVAPSVSSLTAAYVPNNGPWASLSPNFSISGPSVSNLTAAYVPNNGPWASLSPDFSISGPSVSDLTSPYVPDGGPWTPLSPGFSTLGPSVSGLTAPYVPDGGPWISLRPDFSNPHAPQVTVNHSFYTTPNSYNSTNSPYAANCSTADSTGDMERMAETSQPIVDDGTNLTASSANASRQRVTKPRPVCKTCRKSFSRPSDLDRHVKKHQPGARIHMCSVPGCDYEGSYRKDKLMAHVKNCHK